MWCVIAALTALTATASADPPAPTCTDPAPATIRTDSPTPLTFSAACQGATGFVLDEEPAHGRVEPHHTSPGWFFYWPDAGYSGDDSVTYHAEGDGGSSEPVTQAIVVDPDYNRAPFCDPGSLVIKPGRTKTRGLSCFDPDGDALALVVQDPPAHGTASTADRTYTYAADPGYLGDDAFTVLVEDGHGGSEIETVTVTVTEANQAPACQPSFYVARAGKVDFLPGFTCSDEDDDPLSFEVAEQPAHGMVTRTELSVWTITTEAGYTGPDAFTMRVSDGTASTLLRVEGMVTESLDTLPECSDRAFTVAAGQALTVQLGCFDRDGDVPALEIAAPPAPETGSLGPIEQQPQTVRFTPAPGYAGTTRFTYRAVEAGRASAPGTIEITVLPDATAPRLTIASARTQTLRTALASGVAFAAVLDEPGTLTVRVTMTAKQARRLGVAKRAKRPVVVGRASRSVAAGRTRLRVKLVHKARRALRHAKRATLRVDAVATDAAGNRRSLPSRVVLRRR
jgi:hypothetical protein